MESKRERFVRLAEARTNKTIDMIRLIGNLSNRNNYKHSFNSYYYWYTLGVI